MLSKTIFLCSLGAAALPGAIHEPARMGGYAGQGAEHRSDSLPTFERALPLETTSETSANVSIGDLNADGALDIVLAKGRHWPLVDRVLLGDGTGSFPTVFDLGSASDRSYSGVLADMDGDRDLDVVVSNDDPDPKLVYLNDGTGRFTRGSTFGRSEWSTRNARVADMNRDGAPDIIVANRSGAAPGASYICLNRGEGRFDDDCSLFARESATTITPADVDRNGYVDLIVPHRDGGQSHVYLNEAGADLTALSRVPFGPPDAAIRMAEAADLNGDRVLDLVVIDQRTGVGVFFGREDGLYDETIRIGPAEGPTPYALTVSDLNRDGLPDVVVGHVEAPSVVYFNVDHWRDYSSRTFGDSQGSVYGFAIDDLDGDGTLDIAVARSGAPNIVYFGSLP